MGEGRYVPSGTAYDTQRASVLSAGDRACGVPPTIPSPPHPCGNSHYKKGQFQTGKFTFLQGLLCSLKFSHFI